MIYGYFNVLECFLRSRVSDRVGNQNFVYIIRSRNYGKIFGNNPFEIPGILNLSVGGKS